MNLLAYSVLNRLAWWIYENYTTLTQRSLKSRKNARRVAKSMLVILCSRERIKRPKFIRNAESLKLLEVWIGLKKNSKTLRVFYAFLDNPAYFHYNVHSLYRIRRL